LNNKLKQNLTGDKTESDYEDPKFRKLRNFNGAMGIIHAIQGILMLALSNDFSLPIQTNFLKFVEGDIYPVTETIVEIPVGPAIALFLFITAFAHLSVATYGYRWYVRKVGSGINPARWYEYAFTSSLMIVILAMLTGIFDIAALLAIAAANASMNLFGLMMELHNQTTEKTDWTSFYFGTFAGAIPWVIIIVYFTGAITTNMDTVPTCVYVLIVVLLIFWCSFPINMILQYKKVGKWRNYLYGERGYVILSLISKSALAWIIWAGTLRPT
jgi:hypothetical protein